MNKKKEEMPNETVESNPVASAKECFIITPIGKKNSEIYNKTEGLLRSVLTPVLESFNFISIPAHKIDNTGSINKQIIDKIVKCDLVIANLTGVNPNVMYELAIRHSFGKPVIMIAEAGTILPFDIFDQRCIFYSDTFLGAEELKPELHRRIELILEQGTDQTEINNPVYNAITEVAQINNLPSDEKGVVDIIMNRLDEIESTVRTKFTSSETVRAVGSTPISTRPYYSVARVELKDLNDEEFNRHLTQLKRRFAIRIIETIDPSTLVIRIIGRKEEIMRFLSLISDFPSVISVDMDTPMKRFD
ncbi:hypothetical protein ACFSQ3_06675 [Sphingobacterium corticis]|uniref:Nucleoside 2-deoxyribosyltransferase n=1 Tax=Sphingobacterium corticis TaxID=1812823 RepID=A0ABW5NJ54_9SPHI